MVSCVFAFCLLCLFFGRMVQMTESQMFSSVHPESRFISAQVGGNLTLKCFHDGDRSARLYWFKQNLGQKPKIISHFFKYNLNNSSNEELKNNPRFTLDTQDGTYHLTIRDLKCSDSAIYYCVYYLYTLTFLETIIVSVKGSGVNIKAVVQQSASETIQPGGSVTLNCTVHTGTCDGEHSCEKNEQTYNCTYNLPVKSINVYNAGTYYCAVASCGHILFGSGKKLDFEDNRASFWTFWSGAFAFTSILSVLLAFLLCMSNNCGCESSEKLIFAASTVNLYNRSKSQRDQTWSECAYYSVQLQWYKQQ
uniref:Ig-like domain-containing protein n=1 Tax=Neolamprologus brichardi TaxID=32507 RepID=A0A3Q4I161_NEOBR